MEGNRCIIIAIDGPAGSGKTTLAKNLARKQGITYLDTGATYRALAYKALKDGVDPSDEVASAALLKTTRIDFKPSLNPGESQAVILDGEDITSHIRTNEVSRAASVISRHRGVRESLVDIQRDIADRLCDEMETLFPDNEILGIAVEGRDIGTVVFPEAQVKIYLEASLDERAGRRIRDFEPGEDVLTVARAEISARDSSDSEREIAPLKPADDAIHIDNTGWPKSKTLQVAIDSIREKLGVSTAQ